MNKVYITGYLARDPEMRYSGGQEQIAVTRFTVAVNRPARSGEQSKAVRPPMTAADFINCVAFGKAGENIANYFKKGRKILVAGRLQVSGWTDSDGAKRVSVDVVCEGFEFCDKVMKDGEPPAGHGKGGTPANDPYAGQWPSPLRAAMTERGSAGSAGQTNGTGQWSSDRGGVPYYDMPMDDGEDLPF